MQGGGVTGGLRRLGTIIVAPRYKHFHFVIITFALLAHLATHYATYLDATRSLVIDIPYFRLHILHEMEFLLIIVYAGVVFGVRGGLIAVGLSAVTSIPFLFQADIIGYPRDPGEMRDSVLQVSVMLLMGILMVGLLEADRKRRKAVDMARAMEELDKLKTNFLSMASHELRTPISTIFGFADLLETSNPSEQDKKKWVQWIKSESRRLVSIINELLDVSRLQSGKFQLQMEPVELRAVIEEAAVVAGVSSGGHRFLVDLPQNLPSAYSDHAHLKQVLINLLSNATKYSPKGTTIVVGTEHDTNADRLVIWIRDQGVGISEEDQKQLFSTFHRIRRPDMEDVPGTGLGLYIVKSMTEAMGGEVWMRSVVGQGSTFYVAMPVAKEKAKAAV